MIGVKRSCSQHLYLYDRNGWRLLPRSGYCLHPLRSFLGAKIMLYYISRIVLLHNLWLIKV